VNRRKKGNGSTFIRASGFRGGRDRSCLSGFSTGKEMNRRQTPLARRRKGGKGYGEGRATVHKEGRGKRSISSSGENGRLPRMARKEDRRVIRKKKRRHYRSSGEKNHSSRADIFRKRKKRGKDWTGSDPSTVFKMGGEGDRNHLCFLEEKTECKMINGGRGRGVNRWCQILRKEKPRS